MQRKMLYLTLMLLNGCPSIIQAKEVETVSIYYKKEVINGTVFVFREDTTNGNMKQTWHIDNHTVDYQEYLDGILQAEKEESKKERELALVRREKEHRFQQEAVAGLYKKLLRAAVLDVEQIITKINDERLTSFVLFAQDTISRQLFDQLTQHTMPKAQHLLKDSKSSFDVQECINLCEQLQAAGPRLEELFQSTVRNAIASCDDTKMLKDLLTIVQ